MEVPERRVTGARPAEAARCAAEANARDTTSTRSLAAGPDADSRHARQDRVKRGRHYKSLNLLRDFFALPAKCCQLLSQARQDDARGLNTRDHDRLLGQSLDDLCSQVFPQLVSAFTLHATSEYIRVRPLLAIPAVHQTW